MGGADEAAIDRIISECDVLGNGTIMYTEFLTATLSFSDELTDEMLLRLFRRFDVDDSGKISKENLIEAFSRMGRSNIDDEEIAQMIDKYDFNMDGQVSFQEFKMIFAQDKSDSSKIGLTMQDSMFRPLLQPVTPTLPTQKQKLMSPSKAEAKNVPDDGLAAQPIDEILDED